MLVWNGIQTDKLLKQPDCIPTNTASFQLNNEQDSTTSPPSLPSFGVFG